MNLFALSSISIIITSLSVGVFVLIKRRHNKLSLLWAIFCIGISFWGFGSCFAALAKTKDQAYFWWQITYFAVVFIPVFFMHFIYTLLKVKSYGLLIFSYIIGVFYMSLIIFKREIFFGELKFSFGEFYWISAPPLANPFYFSFFLIFYVVIVCYTFFILIKGYYKNIDYRKKYFKIILMGSIIAWTGPELFFLNKIFGLRIYPAIGNFLINFCPFFTAYALFQLLEIEVIIHKGIIYSILIAVLTGVYLLLIMVIEWLVKGLCGYKAIEVSLFAAFIIAILFNPLRNKIQKVIDRIFLGKTPQEIAQENVLLHQELEHSQRLKVATTMALGLAHEIKNPLTTIKIFSEYLPEKFKNNDKEFIDKFSKLVPSEVQRINNIVHKLLDFSKPSSPIFKQTNIIQLIHETLEFLDNEFLKRKIKIHELYGNENLIIKIDPKQTRQVFLNILLNAIDAMPQGGEITISVSPPKDSFFVEINITDTGCGISQKQLQNLFTPFYTTKHSGTGLGLSICQHLIRNHNGIINITSEVNKGTTVQMKLPYKL